MRGKADINQLHINCTNCTMTVGQPNAFGGTFVFFSTHRPTLKKSKRATKQPHQDTANMDRHCTTERTPAPNSGLAKVAVQWLIEHLCFVSSSVVADSFVLRNRHLRQAANRKTKFAFSRHLYFGTNQNPDV